MPIATILTGIAMIVFASSCFKEVPLIGTVFLIPGANILNAKMADPTLRYALFLIGGAVTAFGLFMHVRTGSALKQTTQTSSEESTIYSTGVNLSLVREAKELLDSGAISEEEFSRIKAKLIEQPES